MLQSPDDTRRASDALYLISLGGDYDVAPGGAHGLAALGGDGARLRAAFGDGGGEALADASGQFEADLVGPFRQASRYGRRAKLHPLLHAPTMTWNLRKRLAK